MAKLTFSRPMVCSTFCSGCGTPGVAEALRTHGFKNDDLTEGWTLLRAVGKTKLDADPSSRCWTRTRSSGWTSGKQVVSHHLSDAGAPRAGEMTKWFFKNLSQTEGPAVILAIVGAYLERFGNLTQPEAKGGPRTGGKAAKQKLVERGLTDDVLKEAQALLDKLGGFSGPIPIFRTSKRNSLPGGRGRDVGVVPGMEPDRADLHQAARAPAEAGLPEGAGRRRRRRRDGGGTEGRPAVRREDPAKPAPAPPPPTPTRRRGPHLSRLTARRSTRSAPCSPAPTA